MTRYIIRTTGEDIDSFDNLQDAEASINEGKIHSVMASHHFEIYDLVKKKVIK